MDVEWSCFFYCVVWMFILVFMWFFFIIGYMGICIFIGVIWDFVGFYFVLEDNMVFGKFVKYWKLDFVQVYVSGFNVWDMVVYDVFEEYKYCMYNFCCDNCYLYVVLVLNLMCYNNSINWNMVMFCFFCLFYGKYVR